ncbi:MoaD/ThiS family protein [Aeoliella sp.]|uniref:MoaD/ThiS family protein n=1 Tax=Aeoliella sp. TaxID=2795800 RepID=UPI003CCBCD26
MQVRVQLPSMLQAECGVGELTVAASTVREALDAIAAVRPDVYRCVCDETHAVRRHMNVFVNDAMVSKTAGLDEPLAEGDELSIFTAVSGG